MSTLWEIWQYAQAWFNPVLVVRSERRWRRLAKCVNHETFMAWLADQVAKDMVDAKPHMISIEELIIAVMESPVSSLQHRAERFIETYYGSYPFDDPTSYDTLMNFRQMIQQSLFRYQPK